MAHRPSSAGTRIGIEFAHSYSKHAWLACFSEAVAAAPDQHL
jgi:hypothetical protein